MSSHLPECYLSGPTSVCPMCEAIRLCEQRVERRIDFMLAKAHDYGERTGYAAGVQAAFDAVVKQFRSKTNGTYDRYEDWDNAIDAALAAIDALREES